MRSTLTKFRDILSGNLKPWLKDIATKEQFKLWSSELPSITLLMPNVYSLTFLKAYTPKTIYYAGVIFNDTVKYTNEIKALFTENESENIRVNIIHNALKKELAPILETVSELLEEDYFSDYIDIDNLKRTEPSHKENTHILHLLKASAIQLYLEIQELGKDYLKCEYLELDDIHYQFFNEAIPPFYSIDKQKEDKIPERKKIKKDKPTIHSFKFKNYTREHSRLTYLWEPLCKDGAFIDEFTRLPDFKKVFSGEPVAAKIKWTGYKTELAYLMKQLHNKEKLVESVGQDIWAVTIKCFEKEDGSPFGRNDFRELKKPNKIKVKLLDTAIQNLK